MLALIYTLMRHRALDARRQYARLHVEPLDGLADKLLARRASEDALLAEAAEWHEWLEARLKELEVEHEEYAALLRAFLEGRSYEELAEAKRRSVLAIKCCLTRGFKALQRLAEKHPPGGEPPP